MTSGARPESVSVPRAQLGEGPTWDARAGVLYWVDIPAGSIHRYDPESGSHHAVAVGQPVGSVVPRASGGLVAAVRDGFAFCDPETGALELVAPVEVDRPANRMNDGKCDPAGAFLAGTKAEDDAPGAGALYRLGPDLAVSQLLSDVTISNGLDWSPDGRTMYYVDSPTGRIDRFDRDPATGLITGRRPFVEIQQGAGWPDGLTVDAEGGVWLALWGGSAVRRYLPDGRLDRVVELPVTRVTSCAFGGSDLETLFITTARPDPAPRAAATPVEAEPDAGALFALRPGVTGRPAVPFAG